MNFIKTMQAENAELKTRLAAASEETTRFLAFLSGPKFTGLDNGERTDWISTADVQRWLAQHRSDLA